MRNRPAAAALLLATTALAAGCNSSDEPTPPPDSTISAPPTAQYLETSEQTVTKGAEAAPNSEAADQFYSASVLQQEREVDKQMEQEGLKMTGQDEVLWTKPGEYQKPDIGEQQTTVDACVVRNVRVLDRDGNDITADQEGQPLKKGTKTLIQYTLTTPDDGKTWLIDSWTEKGTCTAQQQS